MIKAMGQGQDLQRWQPWHLNGSNQMNGTVTFYVEPRQSIKRIGGGGVNGCLDTSKEQKEKNGQTFDFWESFTDSFVSWPSMGIRRQNKPGLSLHREQNHQS